MPAHEEPKRIEPISESEPRKIDTRYSEGAESEGPLKVKFDEAVARADPTKVELRSTPVAAEVAVTEAKKPSLMEMATKIATEPTKVPTTTKTLSAQASDLRRQIERPRAVLIAEVDKNPEVVQNLNPADVDAMAGHLEHIDRGLRDVSSLTTGVETGAVTPPAGKSPAVRFLSYLTESDRKLGAITDEIKGLQVGQQKLTPAVLFAVQIKLGFIQTELEFFTATLNKALESTKTLMNVQI